MKKSKYILMLFIFSGLLFVSAASNSPTIEPEISQFVDLFVKKWNQHDPKELNELWAENGDLMNPAGERKGSDEKGVRRDLLTYFG